MDMAESTRLERDRSFQKAKELRNSTSLRKFKVANYPEVTSLVDHLYKEMVQVLGVTVTRGKVVRRWPLTSSVEHLGYPPGLRP